MEPFILLRSKATPLDRINVDTDQIVPKQFLKLVNRTGFGKFLFYDWRFGVDGKPKKDFVLNDPKYSRRQILLARDNFGSGCCSGFTRQPGNELERVYKGLRGSIRDSSGASEKVRSRG